MNILKVLTRARRTGNLGERAAARYLRRHGYKILERNYVTLDREIDIIAKKDGIHVFVEVKTRTLGKEPKGESRPAAAVTPDKQRSIIIAAKSYMTQNFIRSRSRFDVIEVLLEDGKHQRVKEIRHLIGTFNQNTANKRRYQ